MEMTTNGRNEEAALIGDAGGGRLVLVLGAILTGFTMLAWFLTARQAIDMSGMVTGLGQIGSRMPNDMAVPLFMDMWLTMIVAMMLPTVGPLVLANQRMLAQRGGVWPTLTFLAGYVTVWTVVGVGPLIAFLAFRGLPMEAANSRWLPLVSGLVLVGAGLYQFTPLKQSCLGGCRSSLSFRSKGPGSVGRSALRAGLEYATHCIGCCWALMATLLVVGLMNLLWMAVLTLVFLLERNSKRYGVAFSWLGGALVVILGIVVIARPEFLALLSRGIPGPS